MLLLLGDQVYSRIHGIGAINSIETDCINIDFNDFIEIFRYTKDGRYMTNHSEAILFYVDGENIYSEVKHCPKLDWSKVPTDTLVFVSERFKIDTEEFEKHKHVRFFNKFMYERFSCFIDGASSKRYDKKEVLWNYCCLAEDITIDGILWKKGSF